jgi:hypothetical protein
VSSSYYEKLTGNRVTPEVLVEKSFAFLLERESNISILSSSELPVIGSYFPQHKETIGTMVAADSQQGLVSPLRQRQRIDPMKAQQHLIVGLAISFALAGVTDSAYATCKSAHGRIVSTLVTEFSDGTLCPSLLGLCTEGRFTGTLNGRFRFVATTLTSYADLDPSAPADVAATTGVVTLNSKICSGSIVLEDTSTFSLSPDGSVAGLETIDGTGSTGDCFGATGRLRYMGIFEGGCVDCKYDGEVCVVGKEEEGDD